MTRGSEKSTSLPARVQRLYAAIGTRVRDRRKAASLTQSELATAIFVSRTTITNLELGNQQVPIHVLLAIADTLELELSELVPSSAELALPNVSEAELSAVEIGAGNKRMLPPRAASVITAHGLPLSARATNGGATQ